MNRKEILKKLDELLSKSQFAESNAPGEKARAREKTKLNTAKKRKVKKKRKVLHSKSVK